MGEPAYTLPDESGVEDSIRPDLPGLRALEGGGEGNGVPQGSLRSVAAPDSNSSIPSDQPANSTSPGDDDKEGFYKKLSGTVKNNRKRFFIGFGTGGGIVGLVLAGFFALIPLKIEHIVNNLENRFFAGPQLALSEENQKMLSHYLKRYVLPGLSSCSGSTIDKACKPKVTDQLGSNPVHNLYRSWADARLENTLATKYHIEFRRDRLSGKYYLKAPGNIDPKGEDITKYVQLGDNGDLFQEVNRAELRVQVREALANETKYKQVYTRLKVGRLLESKYGIRRCLFFCGTRDAFADRHELRKKSAQIFLNERVLVPRTASLGIAVRCLLTQCTAHDPERPTNGTETPALNGSPESPETDAQVRQKLSELAAQYGAEDIDAIVKSYNAIAENGLQKYIIAQGLEKIGVSEAVAGSAADRIPIIGYANIAAKLVKASSDLGPDVKKLGYIVNVAAAIKLAVMYQSYRDEIHTGHVSATEVGSMSDTFGSGDVNNKKDPIVGGTATAEQAPLYSYLIDNKTPINTVAEDKPTNLLSFVGTAYATGSAQSTPKSAYLCKNGRPVPSGKMICSEENLGGGNDVANGISEFINSIPGLVPLANLWNNTIGAVMHWGSEALGYVLTPVFRTIAAGLDVQCSLLGSAPLIGGFISNLVGLPGYCAGKDLAAKLIPEITKAVTEYLIPNPWGSNMSGGRKFQLAAAGFDAMGSESAHITLGAGQITSKQASAILNEQRVMDKVAFNSQPLSKRIFDSTSEKSLVSQVAMSMPLGGGNSFSIYFSNFLSHPLSIFGNSFSTIFSARSNAAATPIDDPFGITQYGYPSGSIPDDPAAYWDAHCSDKQGQAYQNDAEFNNDATNWNKLAAANISTANGQPVNATSNPCLLIKSAVGAAGAKYDKSLLTADDVANSNGSVSTGQIAPGQNLDVGTISDDSSNIACAAGTKDLGIGQGYSNEQPVSIRLCAIPNLKSAGEESNLGSAYSVNGADGNAIVNSRVSGAYYSLVQAALAAQVPIAANSSFRTMAHQTALCANNKGCSKGSYDYVAKPGESNHQMGLAIDFNIPLCGLKDANDNCTAPDNAVWVWLNKNASQFSIKQYPKESWHWSPTAN